jgi:hypothetical protein
MTKFFFIRASMKAVILAGGLGIGTPRDQGGDGGQNDNGSHDSFPFSAPRAVHGDAPTARKRHTAKLIVERRRDSDLSRTA